MTTTAPFRIPRGITYQQYIHDNCYSTGMIINTPLQSNVPVTMCDQTASGFPLRSIEQYLEQYIYPVYSNTHSNNFFGRLMTAYIDRAKQSIIKSVHGRCEDDKVIFTGSGSTGAISHLVHMVMPMLRGCTVFVSMVEHYSNYLPWYHAVKGDDDGRCCGNELRFLEMNQVTGRVDLDKMAGELARCATAGRRVIVSVTACSNVSGVLQNIYTMARLCHAVKGLFFVDFAAAAPYVDIDMHHNDANGEQFDAIFISPHKFPGAQSSPGLLVVNRAVVCNNITFTPGGGTVRFACREQGPIYSGDLEVKEMGGTPNIPGIIRTGIVFALKDRFSNEIINHELRLTRKFQEMLELLCTKHPNLVVLNPRANLLRLPIFAIQIRSLHYNFVVVLLNDLFGIVTRGGISCSALFAEDALKLTPKELSKIRENIISGHGVPSAYGWVRITFSAIHHENDLQHVASALDFICTHGEKYQDRYYYDPIHNMYVSKLCSDGVCSNVNLMNVKDEKDENEKEDETNKDEILVSTCDDQKKKNDQAAAAAATCCG